MKKLRLIIFFSLIAVISSAQSIQFGGRYSFNTTWLLNANIPDDSTNLTYQMTGGNSGGFTFVFYFDNSTMYSKGYLGFSVELLSSKHNQKYVYEDSLKQKYTQKINLTYLDIPIMFRAESETGGLYGEVGVQYSFLSKANEFVAGPSQQFSGGLSIKSSYNKSNLAAILGFGFDHKIGDHVVVVTGLRFGYGLSDATKPQSGTPGYKPTHTAFGGFTIAVKYRFVNDHGK
jgi:hypothetical protein